VSDAAAVLLADFKEKASYVCCSVLQTLTGRFYMCRRKLGLIDDRRWEMFESKQARMEADKKRLATTRIQPDSDLAKVFAEVSGQNVNTVHPFNHTVAACFQKLRHSRAS
jgi:tRNA U34 5-carboxymethylaminomethyl modifying enzyme MnmG/GidA